MTDSPTLYERVGGRPFFEALTVRFYKIVADDPVLSRLYPSDPEELEAARRHLELFLVQYWGGPDDYNQTRGHPRLRMRHAPFVIGPAERDAWVAAMSDAVKAGSLSRLDEMQMLSYLTTAAAHLVNQP
ncbi:MAG: globin [Acidobacteriota bacterium]|nr:globin [Acidobacteriota bacterium]